MHVIQVAKGFRVIIFTVDFTYIDLFPMKALEFIPCRLEFDAMWAFV